MDKRIMGILVAVMFIGSSVFAMCGSCGSDAKSVESSSAATVKVNNTVCPVTGEKVDMKNPVTIDYKGETYNLCCSMCVADFNKDPEKFSAKAKQK